MAKEDWLPYARELAKTLEQANCLETEWLRSALFGVPRHFFIDQYLESKGSEPELVIVSRPPTDAHLKMIYSDLPLTIRMPPDHSASSQPQIVFRMLQDLEVEPGNKALEIGTGTGWNTGLLAYRVGDDSLVHSIDIQPDLVEAARGHLSAAGFGRANLRSADAGYGWAEAAPFDRIIVTAGSPDVPLHWVEQLADDGILLVPLATGGIGEPVLRLRKKDGQLKGRFTRWSFFYRCRGDFSPHAEDKTSEHYKSLVDQLLGGEHRGVPILQAINDDFLFFLYVSGMPVERTGSHTHRGRALYDPESESIFLADNDPPLIYVAADSSLGQQLVGKQREWIELGRPRLTDYEIEVVDACANDPRPGEWVDRRPSVTLKLSFAG